MNAHAIQLLGAPGSPYTRKMLALLRYRRIPYRMRWGSHRNPPDGLPSPKVQLLPTFYFPTEDGVEAMTDSTPIIRRLERAYEGRSVLPQNAVLAFLGYLIEDYADEWLTKAMFHYRWAHAKDATHAGPQLIFWQDPTLADEATAAMARAISRRQIDRLYVVGSNATTAATIEASYMRLLDALNGIVRAHGFVLGKRPSAADFAIYGQMTQLAIVEPTPGAICEERTPRVRAWLDRMEDLSGLEPNESDWLAPGEARETLAPLLSEIGRVYAPFLLANAAAAEAGKESFETEIDGRPWTQPTFPYQAKCRAWIREEFARLDDAAQAQARAILAGTGCEALL